MEYVGATAWLPFAPSIKNHDSEGSVWTGKLAAGMKMLCGDIERPQVDHYYKNRSWLWEIETCLILQNQATSFSSFACGRKRICFHLSTSFWSGSTKYIFHHPAAHIHRDRLRLVQKVLVACRASVSRRKKKKERKRNKLGLKLAEELVDFFSFCFSLQKT